MSSLNKKLDRWAEKLLDTGKRNNLINFHDTKAASAEIVSPGCESVFSKCSVGHAFQVFDPKLKVSAYADEEEATRDALDYGGNAPRTREEYIRRYEGLIEPGKEVLAYAQTPNPMTAITNIAKKAKQMEDETGINVSYLAFGFLRWSEKEGSDVTYRAPLLLVHTSILTGSILDPVKIEVCDDDVVVNPTFNYLLQAEYGLSLPQYEDGQTLASYYEEVSNLVGKLGWEVLDECKIGIFSFLKMNMYEDLMQNRDAVLANPNVLALLGEGQPNAPADDFHVAPVENPLVDLHTVVDADSSQIEAIEMAKSGKSFVLQGPPGTGKSQTITNVIAELLHDGRKVLFVSEKQAALNVVFDKLTKVGLADFCLELHSHKANKREVIDEINRTLELPKSGVSSRAEEEIRRKSMAQQKLDSYAVALHQRRDGIELSLYQLYEQFSAQRSYPDVSFLIDGIESKGQDWFLRATALLERYVDYIPSIGYDFRENSWYGFLDPEITFEDQTVLRSDLERLCEGYKNLLDKTEEVRSKYEAPYLSLSDTTRWQSMLSMSAESDVVTPSLFDRARLDEAYPIVERMRELAATIVPSRDKLLEAYDREALTELDGRGMHQRLTGDFGSFFSRLFNAEYKGIVTSIRTHSKSGAKPSYQQAVDFSESLMRLQSATEEFTGAEWRISGLLGSCYRGPDTNWEHVIASLDELRSLLAGDEELGFGSFSRMSPYEFARRRGEFRDDASDLAQEMDSVRRSRERVSALFSTDVIDLERDPYANCIAKLAACLADFDKLGNWKAFLELLEDLESTGLMPFVYAAIDGKVDQPSIVGAFRKGYYRQWIQRISFSTPDISSFTRIAQDQAVRTFVEKDKLQYMISRVQIASELSQRRPNLDLIAGGSALAILRREGRKKRKQMPIRKLLSETGELIQTIKPCFLMSPLSVSTFLDPEKLVFDTVVFDEASQIFPQDAVGAIYRAKQLIVVGDSRQMPPSDFFGSSMDIEDDEDAGDINDFESILDICSSVFNTKRLSWHYRSHYEQLIAFSNLNFYNNGLVTFPSSTADHEGVGVDYYRVNGVFDRRSKTNTAEAEYVADLVFRHFEEHPERSIGVVAFSAAQQGLIDRVVSRRRELNPAYEEFFSSTRREPFFVKNLETVQGDERDTIIFSVAYAPDAQGRFIHNFGPLNREGGERRLNVAVTRAKDNVKLVSSIAYTDIDLSRTSATGSRLLRTYLDFAQNGETALERAITVAENDQFDSYFEEEVCDFLRDHGLTVDTQIGCSGYRIDMGLRIPDSSNYLLAIECDGATYHSSKNARDRDSLRQRVLENMGWEFYRIWSTDWFRNTAVEKERLLNAAQEALRQAAQQADGRRPASATINEEPKLEERQQFVVTEPPLQQSPFQEYRQVDAVAAIRRHRGSLQDGILEVLKVEAPLSEELLLKRIVSLFGRKSVTKVVVREYEAKMRTCHRVGIVRRDGFLYLNGTDEIRLRVPGDKREVRHISIEELAAGLLVLIDQNGSVSRDGLYRVMGEILGFKRTGDAMASRFDEAITRLRRLGKVKLDGDMLTIA